MGPQRSNVGQKHSLAAVHPKRHRYLRHQPGPRYCRKVHGSDSRASRNSPWCSAVRRTARREVSQQGMVHRDSTSTLHVSRSTCPCPRSMHQACSSADQNVPEKARVTERGGSTARSRHLSLRMSPICSPCSAKSSWCLLCHRLSRIMGLSACRLLALRSVAMVNWPKRCCCARRDIRSEEHTSEL